MKIGFIGTGNMGGALLQAFSTLPEHSLGAYNRGRDKLTEICRATGAQAMDSARAAAAWSDLLVLAVKPQVMPSVLEEIADATRTDQLIVTVAAGLPLSLYSQALGEDKKLVRTLPNTPAKVQAGMTVFCCGDRVTQTDRSVIQQVFAAAGRTEEIPESLMDAAGSLTGCSPAYVFMFIEALADAAVLSGVPRAQAYPMAAQAVFGSAKLLLETGQHPGALKDAVCSPGGTTIRGVAALEQAGFRSAVIQGLQAAIQATGGLK